MRLMLEGLALETTEYSENGTIHFTVFTYGEQSCTALSDTLASPERVLDLRRGDEHLAVRVCEHEIWPPYARRYGATMQRHNVQLEAVDSPNSRSGAAWSL
jgi:hypothetical protein